MEDGAGVQPVDAPLGDSKLGFPGPPRQRSRRARSLFFLLRLLGGLGLLTFILSRVEFGAATVRPSLRLLAAVGAAAVLLVMSQGVAAARWRIILDDAELPWRYLLRLYLIGSFFSLFLPTSVGGDGVRALATARSTKRAGHATASVLIDRGFGMMAALAYAALGYLLVPHAMVSLGDRAVRWHGPGLTGVAVALAVAGAGLVMASRSERIRAFCADGAAAMVVLSRYPRRVALASALAIVSQGLIILLWYTLAVGVNFALPVSLFLWAVPLVSVGALLPVTLSGLGVREGIWLVLLGSSGIPAADIVTFSLLYFVCTLLVGIAGGVLFVSLGVGVRVAGRKSRDDRVARPFRGASGSPPDRT